MRFGYAISQCPHKRPFEEMAEMTSYAFDLIVALRGGLPDRCDFCHQPYTDQRHPVPEEGGEWACTECWAP